MAERNGPAAYVPTLRELADLLERAAAAPAMPAEDSSADVEIGVLELSPTYRWTVRSSYGVVKVWSSRDSCMLAVGPEGARRLGRAFAAAMDAAADATERATRGEPRVPEEAGDAR